MKQLFAATILLLGFCLTANADVWKWVDASGNTHFVDTMKPIYTWVDEFGKVHYGDTPDHEDAVAVQLVWHSMGSVDPIDTADDGGNKSDTANPAFPVETDAERAEREIAEAYYCKRTTEAYESYLNAPQLYRTDDNGERQILSKKEAAATIAETKSKMNEVCR